MTSLLSAKKRAEEFAAVVDGGADESTLRPELRELVGVVGTLQREAQAGADFVPRPEFTVTLREQLMAEAATSLASDDILKLPVRRKGTRERRIALAASSFVLIGGTAGMAAAAQNALPGEALYPIKRGLENAEAGLAGSREEQGQDLLAQAESRLAEVEGLFDASENPSQVPDTIQDFNEQALEASQVLLEEYESSGDESLIEDLRGFAAENLGKLQDLSKDEGSDHLDELAAAADVLLKIDSAAQKLCSDCASDLGPLEMPTLLLAANEVREAMDAAGRAAFHNSHPLLVEEFEHLPSTGEKKDRPQSGDGSTSGGKAPGTGSTGTPETAPTEETDTDSPGGGTDSPADDQGIEVPGDVKVEAPAGNPTESLGVGGSNGGGKDDGAQDKGDGDVIPEELEDAVETLVP